MINLLGKHYAKDQKEAIVNHPQFETSEATSLMEIEMKSLHIEGRRWFQRTYGNTYHTVRIFIDGELVHTSDRTYGYGDSFLQTTLDWLKANGFAPADAKYGTLYLCETLGGTYSTIDVSRQKDL